LSKIYYGKRLGFSVNIVGKTGLPLAKTINSKI
jgi:hypothetical protein